MKTPAHLFRVVSLLVLVCVLSAGGAQAQEQLSPLFGSSYSIDSVTYNVVEGGSISDGTYQTDTYSDGSSGTLSIRGKLGNPYLGEVTGAFSKYYHNGAFKDYTQTVTNEPDTHSFNGRDYTSYSGTTTYEVDLANGQVLATSYTRTYTDGTNSFVATMSSNGLGTITGSEAGYIVNRGWHVNEYSSQTWQVGFNTPGNNLFGSTYYLTYQWTSKTYNEAGTRTDSNGESFTSDNGGSYSQSSDGSTSGNDAYVGDWSLLSGGFTNPSFSNRSAPKFVPNAELVMWVKGVVVNWDYSTIDTASGNITDHWKSADERTFITVTGNARAFEIGEGQAPAVSVVVQDTSNNSTAYWGSVTKSAGLGSFAPVLDIQLADPNHSEPLFTVGTLYVGNVPFAFQAGYQDVAGNRTDRYAHTSGTLTLIGQVSAPQTAEVGLSIGGVSYAGDFASGVFIMDEPAPPDEAPVILTQALTGPEAFWVNGALYTRVPSTNSYATAVGLPQVVVLSGTDAASLSLSGMHTDGAVAGTYNAESSGVFTVAVDGAPRIACPAAADGVPQPGSGDLPSGFPAGVKVEGTIWGFLGVVADDAGSGDVACYGRGQETLDDVVTPRLSLLKINTAGTAHAVSLRKYALSGVKSGTYDSASSLFQTSAGSSTVLPAMHRVVLPAGDRWLNTPPTGLPPSFMVRGAPWWLAGYDELTHMATYLGYVTGQSLVLGPPTVMPDGTTARQVTLTDSMHNGGASTQGTLSNLRGSVRLRDGTLVLSGNEAGTQQTIAHADDYKLHTIASDVDIIGNTLSFGILNDDASLAGAVFQFRDNGVRSSLHSTLSRTEADWFWWKQDASNLETLRAVMYLDPYHRLQLYPPPPTSAAYPGIVLDPQGTSTFKGPVRAAAGGDISMGSFTEGTPP